MLDFLKSVFGFIPHLFTVYAINAENKALKKEIDLLESQKEKCEQEHADYKRQQSEAYDVLKRENEVLREKRIHKIPSENERETSRLKVLNYDPFERINAR